MSKLMVRLGLTVIYKKRQINDIKYIVLYPYVVVHLVKENNNAK